MLLHKQAKQKMPQNHLAKKKKPDGINRHKLLLKPSWSDKWFWYGGKKSVLASLSRKRCDRNKDKLISQYYCYTNWRSWFVSLGEGRLDFGITITKRNFLLRYLFQRNKRVIKHCVWGNGCCHTATFWRKLFTALRTTTQLAPPGRIPPKHQI